MGAIDVWAQITTERMARQPWMATLLRWTGRPGEVSVPSVASTLKAMDAAGVDIALLSAWHGPQGSLISNEEVAACIDAAPDRFRGLATVDLTDPVGVIRNIRRFDLRCGRITAVAALLILTACTLGMENAVAATSQVASEPVEPAIAAAFDDYLQAAVEHDHFSGTVLVARDGMPVFSNSYGMANYELNVPNTPDTLFSIASMTKQFTALAIMQLQEQGRLSTGDQICNYLDDCPAAWRPITIHQLLTHTSGIPNYSRLPDWDEFLVARHYRHGDLVKLFRDLSLEFTPGTEHRYSNSGYQLLGLIIERASGMPYAQFLDEHIFAPLGMTHTRYSNDRLLVPNRAAGYYSRGSSFINTSLQSPTVPFGDAGIFSTAGDLLLWDQALYSERLLSRESLEKMFTPALDGYAYGWRVGESLGRRQVNHSGSGEGFSSYLIRFPHDHVTVIVLSNSDATNATRIGLALAAIYFDEDYKLPVTSLHDILWDVFAQDGVTAALKHYHELQRARPSAYDFNQDETLVELGYHLYEADLLEEARQIFDFALQIFPESAYSHDGLADIAMVQNDYATAIHHFSTSLSLDPDNDYAARGLARIREHHSQHVQKYIRSASAYAVLKNGHSAKSHFPP